MVKLTSLLILFTLVTLVSCSQKGSNVKLEVSHNFIYGGTETSTSAGGGLMVWGQSSTGASFGKALEGSDEINFQLPNGTWTFYAMAWDGSSDYQGDNITTPLGGNTKCAKSAAVTLGGDAAVVDLTVNSTTCLDPVFKGAPTVNAANGTLPKVQFNFCSKVGSHITGPNTICADTKNDPKTVEKKAPVTSFRVKMRNHFSNTSNRALLDGGVTGACIAMAGDSEGGPESSSKYGASANLMPNLPAGGPGLPFHFTLEMFVGSTDCDASSNQRGMIPREFPNGVASVSESTKYFAHAVSPDARHRQYVALSPEVICNSRKATTQSDHPFAAGLGTQESPYIICSVPQWHAINSNASYFDKHFKLQSDLDFNPFSKGFGLTTTLPSCVELGTNFIPVGYSSPTCTAPTDPLVLGTLTPFTGSLEGANHTLKNLRFRGEDDSYIGLFAKLSGINVEVKNLNIEKAEISGLDNVGALSGFAQDISYVFNVKASHLDIEARENTTDSFVGSIIGALEGGTLEKIIVSTSKVRGESSKIGGIVGYATSSTLKYISSEVNIEANSSGSVSQVGGVVGRVEVSNLDYVKHEGGITTNGTQLGGIAGSLIASSLTNFYTISNIHTNSSNTSTKMGGVVGDWDSTGTFGKGYSLSNVKSACMTGCMQGGIVGEKISSPGTTYPHFVLSDDESGAGTAKAMFTDPESLITYAESTTPATFSSFPNSTTNDWQIISNQYPRFDFEKHPCLNSPSGTGTISSPSPVCNQADYLNLGTAPAGSYYKLLSNIRLSNQSSGLHEITNFYAHLDGAGKALLGGDSTNNSAGVQKGHIGTLRTGASIRNLKIHGLARKSTANSSEALSHGVFVATNLGVLENIEANTFGDFTDYGAGVVGINQGTMKKITFNGLVKGTDKLTTLAVVNSGSISESVSNGEVRCKENAGCDYLTGLVLKNNTTGSIKRAEVNTRISEEPGSPANFVSLLVDNNLGVIEDVYVSREAQANISGTEASLFHITNTGTLNRVINFGSLLSTSSSYVALPGFPLAGEEAAVSGHTSVLRGGVSGIRILGDKTYTCASNVITVPDWSIVASSWNPNLGGVATNLLITFRSEDETYTSQVDAYNGGSYTFTLPSAPSFCGDGTVSIYYTTDVPDLATDQKILYPHESRTIANFSAAWQPHIWDTENNSTHMNEMLSYFKFILGVSSTPVVPRSWEIPEGEDIELFLGHKD